MRRYCGASGVNSSYLIEYLLSRIHATKSLIIISSIVGATSPVWGSVRLLISGLPHLLKLLLLAWHRCQYLHSHCTVNLTLWNHHWLILLISWSSLLLVCWGYCWTSYTLLRGISGARLLTEIVRNNRSRAHLWGSSSASMRTCNLFVFWWRNLLANLLLD